MADREYNAARCEQHDKDLDMIVAQMQKLTDAKNENNADLGIIQTRLGTIQSDITDIKKKLDEFCKKEDFILMRTQWYYFVGLLATGVVGAVLALLFKGVKS